MKNKILSTSNLYEPKIDDVLSLVDSFSDVSGNLIEGMAVQKLEAELCEYHKSKYCVSFNSGFWALVAGIVNKSIDGRKNIIMPSLTYRRLADVVYWTKHTPVFVDIDANNLAISPNAVKKYITNDTALILAVHPIVNCCNVIELISISQEYGIPIIFDAVESVHETYQGRRVGSFGVGEVFSFHASKLINGIEGGYICTNDKDFSKCLKLFRDGDNNGISSKMNDIHAILAISSLTEIDHNVKHNKTIYAQYKNLLASIPYIRLLEFDESEQTSFKNIVIEIMDGSPLNRDNLLSFLNEKNILARPHYYPPLHLKSNDFKTLTTDMRNTEYAKTKYVNLPCGFRVDPSDIRRVCSLIKEHIDSYESKQ